MFLIMPISGSPAEGEVLRVPPVDRRHAAGGDFIRFEAGSRVEEGHGCRQTGLRRPGRGHDRLQPGQARVQERIPPGRIPKDCRSS